MNIQKKEMFLDDDDYEVKIWIENCRKWKLHFRDNLWMFQSMNSREFL